MTKNLRATILGSGALLLLFFVSGQRYLVEGMAGLTLAAVWILWMVWAGWRSQRGLPLYWPADAWAYILPLVSMAVSTGLSVDFEASSLDLMLWVICWLLFLFTINISQDPNNLRVLIRSILMTGIIYNAIQISQGIIRLVGILMEAVETKHYRLFSPNKSAAFVGLMMILSLSILLNDNDKYKPWPAALMISSLPVLLMSGSRAGAISAGVGLLVVLVVSRSLFIPRTAEIGSIRHLLTLSVVLIPSVALIFATRLMAGTGNGGLGLGDLKRAASVRVRIWSVAVEMFSGRPVIGTGPNTFWYYARPALSDLKPVSWSHPHSLYLDIMAEGGMLGLISISALLMVILGGTLLTVWDSTASSIGLGAVSAVLIHGLVDHPLEEPYIMRLLVILVGLSLAPNGLITKMTNRGA